MSGFNEMTRLYSRGETTLAFHLSGDLPQETSQTRTQQRQSGKLEAESTLDCHAAKRCRVSRQRTSINQRPKIVDELLANQDIAPEAILVARSKQRNETIELSNRLRLLIMLGRPRRKLSTL
jgi:hypothetical protein